MLVGSGFLRNQRGKEIAWQRLFHRTTAEGIRAILSEGFRDGEDGGVWFSTRLDDWGAGGQLPLEVFIAMADAELTGYAVGAVADEVWDEETGDFVVEEAEADIERFTWYKIPADVIKASAVARALPRDEYLELLAGFGRGDADEIDDDPPYEE